MTTIGHEGFRLVGLALPHTTTNENGQSALDCGSLWQQFEKQDCAAQIPGRTDDTVVAVYYGYEGDHTRPYHYFIGCPVSALTPVPEGMRTLDIPKDVYHPVTAKGVMPDCVANAWRAIWAGNLPRAYYFDFEVYGPKSHDWNHAEVEIFVSCAQ